MTFRTFSCFGAATLVALAVAAAPALAQMSHDGTGGMDHSTPIEAGPIEAGSASARYRAAMKTMDEAMGSMAMTGKPGVDYATMMIPHHRSAIDMAKAYLASGEGDPVLTKLSNDIVASQEIEIATLREWLARNGAK